jgi:hypothetical protein
MAQVHRPGYTLAEPAAGLPNLLAQPDNQEDHDYQPDYQEHAGVSPLGASSSNCVLAMQACNYASAHYVSRCQKGAALPFFGKRFTGFTEGCYTIGRMVTAWSCSLPWHT